MTTHSAPQPDIPLKRHATTSVHNLAKTKSGSYYGQDAIALRRAMRESDPKPFEGPVLNGHAITAGPPVHIRVDSTGSAKAPRNSGSNKPKGKEKERDDAVRDAGNEEKPAGGTAVVGEDREGSVLGLDDMDAQTGDRAHFVFYQDDGVSEIQYEVVMFVLTYP